MKITFPYTQPPTALTAVGRYGYRNKETGVELQKWVEPGNPVEWLVIAPTLTRDGHRIITSVPTRRAAMRDATRYIENVARPALAAAWDAAYEL